QITINKNNSQRLKKLRCHFTWNLQEKEGDNIAIEEKLIGQMESRATYNKHKVYNLMAYIKYVQGDYIEAMARLREAEELCRSNSNQSPAKYLVIYGNYAWLNYILKEHEMAQLYVEKVESIYQELQQSNDPNLFNCPEIYGEQGWTLLIYGGRYYEQAKECFEKALESAPEDPDWNTAIELNPKDSVVKTLLGLKLQDLKEKDEGLKYIEEALEQTPVNPYVLRYVAKFYRLARMYDEALRVLKTALGFQPKSAFILSQIGLCYKYKFIDVKQSKHPNPNRQKEINEHIQKAIYYLELALEYEKSFKYVYVALANMYQEKNEIQKAEELFQTLLGFESLTRSEKQSYRFEYGKFAFFGKKSEAEAINHYKEALMIPGSFREGWKCENELKKRAERKLRYNPEDSLALGLLGLVYKVQGENAESLPAPAGRRRRLEPRSSPWDRR
uniref:Interferon-induced protein with tetratricopeptide repeats 5 n=1 Tax=Leptobrachium leishanense TaxID=445787 RepID=A0A8C5N2G0_9ANUR